MILQQCDYIHAFIQACIYSHYLVFVMLFFNIILSATYFIFITGIHAVISKKYCYIHYDATIA